jgi:hypothetical protein
MEANLPIFEVFRSANLSPSGPVPWGTDVPESSVGVYVVSRVDDPKVD